MGYATDSVAINRQNTTATPQLTTKKNNMDSIQDYQAQIRKQAEDTQSNNRHVETQVSLIDLQKTVVSVAKSLVEFIEGNTTRTVLLNQIEDFATTDDAQAFTSAINSLHDTLKERKDVDLSELTDTVKLLLAETKAIPKEHPEEAEQKFVDYSEQFKNLTKSVEMVVSAVKAQETTVTAPDVNVEAPVVKVDAPDLKPLSKEVTTAFSKAIQSIVFPEYTTDNKEVEKLLKKQNELLSAMNNKSTSGGGGGSSSIAPFMVEGALPTASPTLANRVDDTVANTVYIGNAPIGSASSGAVWQIKRLDTSSGVITMWADGDSQFNNIWDNRASLSYS